MLPTEIKQMIIQRSLQDLLDREVGIVVKRVNMLLESIDDSVKLASEGFWEPTLDPMWQDYLRLSGRRYDALLRRLVALNRTDLMVLGSPLQLMYSKACHEVSNNDEHHASMTEWSDLVSGLRGIDELPDETEEGETEIVSPFERSDAGRDTAFINAFDGNRRLWVINYAVTFFTNRIKATLCKMPSGIDGKNLVDTAPACRDKSCSICDHTVGASNSLIEGMRNVNLWMERGWHTS